MVIKTETSQEQRSAEHLAEIVRILGDAEVDHWLVKQRTRPGRTRLATFEAPDRVLSVLLARLGPIWHIEVFEPLTNTWTRADPRKVPPAPAAFRMYTTTWDPGGNRKIGLISSVEVESWERTETDMVSPQTHARGLTIPLSDERTEPMEFRGQQLTTWESLTAITPMDWTEPVDVVYTWVSSSDPKYWAARKKWLSNPATDDAHAKEEARHRSFDELKFSLRSLDMYAPFVRNIYLVTDDQKPDWLDERQVILVDHRDILDGFATLPTFNSHAIESGLHRIPGMSEHFIYFNDDLMLGDRTTVTDFFTINGLPAFQPSSAAIAPGPPAPDETAPGLAGRNVRALLERDFGVVLTQKLKHTPLPMRRSINAEVESRYAQEWKTTAGNQFRSASDIAPIQLVMWYALLTGRAVTIAPRYAYLDLAGIADRTEMLAFARPLRRAKFFCFNMRDDALMSWEEMTSAATELLEVLFPFKSRFEL